MDDPLWFGIAPEFHIGKGRLLVTPDGKSPGKPQGQLTEIVFR